MPSRQLYGRRFGLATGGTYRELGFPEWTPLDLGSSLALWLRADLGVTLNGSTVSAWADQSGRGGNFSQGTGAAQPTFVPSGMNSLPSVDFTGASYMATTGLSTSSGNHLIVAVMDVDSVAVNKYVFDSQTGRVVAVLSHSSTANGLGYVDVSFRSVGALPSTGQQVVEWDLRSSPGGRVYVNGALQGSAATYTQRALGGTTTIGATMPTGGSNWLDARLSELIVVSGQTDVQRSALRRYVASRYNLSVSA